MLETRDLHRFAVLAEECHFGRAAQRLGIGQPHLSRALQRLEQRLGVQLIRRTSREVAPTEAGVALLDHARRILAIAAEAPVAAQRAARGEAGHLALGFSGSCAYAFLPKTLEGFRRARPGVTLTLREMAVSALIDAVREGRFDLCLLRTGRPPDHLGAALVFEEPMILAMPRGHALAGRSRIDLGDLRDSPFVAFPQRHGSEFHRLTVETCGKAGFLPRIAQEVAPMHAVIGLVGVGVGVALVPESVRKLRFDGVVYRTLLGAAPRSQVWAVWPRERITATAEAFLRHLGVRA